MLLPEKHSLKRDIALVLAFTNAGFKLTNSKSVTTHDGACWQATLAHGRTKIVTVSNGGFGGPDETQFHANSEASKAVDSESIETLFAVPEISAAVRAHMLDNLELQRQYDRLCESVYDIGKTDIESRVPAPTNDNLEFLIARIADVIKMVTSFKKATQTKLLVVFEGGDEKGEYVTYKLTDTPANREHVKAHEMSRKIDYFIADLFGATNETKAA